MNAAQIISPQEYKALQQKARNKEPYEYRVKLKEGSNIVEYTAHSLFDFNGKYLNTAFFDYRVNGGASGHSTRNVLQLSYEAFIDNANSNLKKLGIYKELKQPITDNYQYCLW